MRHPYITYLFQISFQYYLLIYRNICDLVTLITIGLPDHSELAIPMKFTAIIVTNLVSIPNYFIKWRLVTKNEWHFLLSGIHNSKYFGSF